MVARRTRSCLLAGLLAAAAICGVAQWLVSPAFVQQPRATNAVELSAAGTLAALTASVPAEAYSYTGPLTGSEVCSSKPLVWFIYPLCDPIFLSCPIYLFPILLIFYGGIITVINLLIPATQPDEDLR
eukprot:CAMPEP_0197884686 /NCGR_PEP_ID=MMETSP1439-20131203/11054_1 /TAXON_ID=66791 /ORGANISM="Gonyaulax spinifera, Strain CCMP409" /LENGTH=127 /DNA_ID=CAMNT_0043504425 /DNA_START=68 /DNA_END=451 /DNA_ORIENTATION=+